LRAGKGIIEIWTDRGESVRIRVVGVASPERAEEWTKMTKPTKEEIAALECWHSALLDAEVELGKAVIGGVRLWTAVTELRRKSDSLLRSIEGEAGQ
jgi:hypothetical protein